MVSTKDVDLIIFMMGHPRRANNKLGEGKKRPLFYLENKNLEAKERVLSKSLSDTCSKNSVAIAISNSFSSKGFCLGKSYT